MSVTPSKKIEPDSGKNQRGNMVYTNCQGVRQEDGEDSLTRLKNSEMTLGKITIYRMHSKHVGYSRRRVKKSSSHLL